MNTIAQIERSAWTRAVRHEYAARAARQRNDLRDAARHDRIAAHLRQIANGGIK